uniref:Uncharacterized protein n=1 Tax=Cannabis sativa TaxID=3483 RepID=A0A803Q2F1_CANSA
MTLFFLLCQSVDRYIMFAPKKFSPSEVVWCQTLAWGDQGSPLTHLRPTEAGPTQSSPPGPIQNAYRGVHLPQEGGWECLGTAHGDLGVLLQCRCFYAGSLCKAASHWGALVGEKGHRGGWRTSEGAGVGQGIEP